MSRVKRASLICFLLSFLMICDNEDSIKACMWRWCYWGTLCKFPSKNEGKDDKPQASNHKHHKLLEGPCGIFFFPCKFLLFNKGLLLLLGHVFCDPCLHLEWISLVGSSKVLYCNKNSVKSKLDDDLFFLMYHGLWVFLLHATSHDRQEQPLKSILRSLPLLLDRRTCFKKIRSNKKKFVD